MPAEVRRFGDRSLRERVLLELPVGRSPPQGAVLAFRASGRRASRPRRRLRRAQLAGAPRRPRRAPRRRLANRRPARRDRRRLRSTPCACRARDRPWARRGAACGARGDRARRGRGALGRAPGQLQGLRASTTCWPSRDRTSPSSRSACSGLPGCSGSHGSPPRWWRSRRSAPTCSRSAGSRRSSGPVSRAGWPRSPGSCRGRATAGTSSSLGAAVLLAWTPASLLEPGFQLSFAAVGSIFLLAAEAAARARGLSADRLAARRARGLDRLRSGHRADPVAPVRERAASTRCSRTCSSRLAMGPLLGLALVGSLLEPLLPSAALALALLNGWIAAYIAACARLVGGLPFARIGSGAAVCVLLGTPLALLALQRLPRWRRPAAIACAATVVPALLVVAALPGGEAAAADRAPDHVSRRGAGRRGAAPGARRERCSSTRDRPRRRSRSSFAASACVGWPQSC